MAKLKIEALPDDKSMKVTLELPASLHRDLVAYAEVLQRECAQTIEPASLVAPMLVRFMAADRAFRKARKQI
jgi:hypothetical protein